MRPIDADALMREQKPECDKCGAVRESCLIPCIMAMVEDAPTIEVEAVQHGIWTDTDDEIGKFICSVCNGYVYRMFGKSNYCPHCGAKMDGVEQNAAN